MPELKINETYGVMIVKDLKPVYVDDNYASIYGYKSSEELMNSISSFLDLIEPSERQLAKDNYFLQMSGQLAPKGRTYRNKDRYGNSLTVFTIDHVIDWNGEAALQVTVVDLTRVAKIQSKLKENERKYKELITNSGQGMIVHKDFRPVFVNQAWVNLMNAPSITYVIENVNLLDIVPREKQANTKQRYRDLISGKIERAQVLIENICFDGKTRYFNVYDNQVDWDGEPALQTVVEDVTERVNLEERLRYLATTDPLTQVANRRRLNDLLEQFGTSINLTDVPFSIIMFDLDFFKSINDNWGHEVGDKALVDLAKALMRHKRERDSIGRWGGEEFMMICPETPLNLAQELAENLRLMIESLTIDARFSITASLGVVTAKRGESVRELIVRADAALYSAKKAGRNHVITSK
ncbi:diguanylate cyclase [Vibrio rotiferianus]|uniref:diguanylate cyclase n=1 Tax=Vibrio rotiferianus TaxID=190895 RepID=A0A7Y3ZDR0_9VIBR|nr:sensor domain-containing diguanylate cyclase [Vibrio rotiferianus]NOH51154.1 diguanylate cyclase [Vibrio rotiferianus]